jgi:cell division protein FtsW
MKKTDAESLGSPDWILFGAVAALVALGLMMVYSATFDMGNRLYDDSAFFFKRQATWLLVGMVALFVTARMRYQTWMKLSIIIMAAAVGLLFVLVAVKKGRLLFGSSVSPVELAKLAVVVYISHWLASRGELLRRLPYGLLPFTIMVGIIAGLVMAQPDLSEALVIVLMAVAMFFLAGADLIQFVIGILGGGAAFAFVVTRLPTAMERLQPFLLEWKDPLHSSNEQLVQGLIALGSGGLFGLGPGNGRMKYQWLPAVHTDSIYALVGEELGLIGCVALLVLFGIIAYRGFRIADRAPDAFGRLLASGITCWILFQAMINMAVVTGSIPFTGIVLPFISVGGSSLVFCLIGVGIMLSISRAPERDRSPASAAHEPRVLPSAQLAKQGRPG